MTAKQGACVSFSLLLVALICAWLITKPEPAPRGRPRPPPLAATPAADAAAAPVSRASRPASRARLVAQSRASGPRAIAGRVVEHGSHEPAPGAHVKLTFGYATAPDLGVVLACGADGRFSAPIPPGPEPALVSLEVATDKGTGRNEHDVFPPFRGTTDMGDVELSTMQIVWFHVVSASGAPVEGACAHPSPGGSLVATADADGNGRVESNVPIRSIRFAAPGFELRDVPVPPGEDSLEVKLQPAMALAIQVTTAAGPPNPSSTVVIVESSQSPCFVEPGDPLWEALDNAETAGRVGRAFRYKPNAPGAKASLGGPAMIFRKNLVRLGPIRPGTRMSVFAFDEVSGARASQDLELAGVEPLAVQLVLPGQFGRLSGRAVSLFSAPVSGATVFCEKKKVKRTNDEPVPYVVPPQKEATRLTSEDGSFDFGALPEGTYEVRVLSPSHGQWRADHTIEPGAEPLSIQLDPGVTVKVRVLDSHGSAVAGASVYAVDRFATTDGEGAAVLPHLPRGRVTIEVVFEGVKTPVEHETGVEDRTIRLENAGR
jgi:hypothetical protein